jgi:hypothetical protein
MLKSFLKSMDIITFHDRIYGKYNTQLFTFEPTWDSFRPISGVGWDGKQLVPDDNHYKLNIFDPWYGYGSLEVKQLCKQLTRDTELGNAREIIDPIQLWKWYGESHIQWWKDRPCVFLNPCTDKSSDSWRAYLKYLDTRAKTLRHPFRGRQTKRNPLKRLLSK